jgi:hypothetical protein
MARSGVRGAGAAARCGGDGLGGGAGVGSAAADPRLHRHGCRAAGRHLRRRLQLLQAEIHVALQLLHRLRQLAVAELGFFHAPAHPPQFVFQRAHPLQDLAQQFARRRRSPAARHGRGQA